VNGAHLDTASIFSLSPLWRGEGVGGNEQRHSCEHQLGKILAIQFKYFGDAVLMTPALRALREHFPQSEIHLLVPAEIAPLFSICCG